MNGFTKEAWDSADQKTKEELLYGAVLHMMAMLNDIKKKNNTQDKKIWVLGTILLTLIVCCGMFENKELFSLLLKVFI